MSQSVYSVSSLVHYIKQSLDNDIRIQSILIKGEISNFTNHRSGHWYFTLKDARAKISCVMFSSHARRCRIVLKEGMKVIVTASVSMYEAGGSVQLYVTGVQADGLGDLFLQLEEVKRKLAAEGLFDRSPSLLHTPDRQDNDGHNRHTAPLCDMPVPPEYAAAFPCLAPPAAVCADNPSGYHESNSAVHPHPA